MVLGQGDPGLVVGVVGEVGAHHRPQGTRRAGKACGDRGALQDAALDLEGAPGPASG